MLLHRFCYFPLSLSLSGASLWYIGWPNTVVSQRQTSQPEVSKRAHLRGDWMLHAGEHKRSMSWLLAAVMSVCEEDPRKCRSLRRGRQRLRGLGGGGLGAGPDATHLLNDAELRMLSSQLLANKDGVLKRSGVHVSPARGSLDPVASAFMDRPTEKCLTRNC